MNLWQRMPVNLIESQILVAGGAFQMKYRFSDGSEEKCRFFFILKDHANNDQYVFMVTPTTEIKKRIKKFKDDKIALVMIKHSEYESLPLDSLVDCGSPIYKPKLDIISKISLYEIKPLPRLPDPILQRLRHAVRNSKRLTSKQKNYVLGN